MSESQVLSEQKPSEEQQDRKQVFPKHCPICGVDTNYTYFIEDGKTHEKSAWYRCQCGVMFNAEFTATPYIYNSSYVKDMLDAKGAQERFEYPVRLYAPLIEELTYGRMMLDVGYGVPFAINSMKERGWLTWAIDINPTLTGSGNIYKGDFINYDFNLGGQDIFFATGVEKLSRKFDLIWMSHVLESMEDPITALKKAYDLLDPKGVLYISTPDVDFINKTGITGWPYFKGKEHNIMWTEPALKRELERLGYKIIMCRRNYASRFMKWYNLHIIAQKNYF